MFVQLQIRIAFLRLNTTTYLCIEKNNFHQAYSYFKTPFGNLDLEQNLREPNDSSASCMPAF